MRTNIVLDDETVKTSIQVFQGKNKKKNLLMKH